MHREDDPQDKKLLDIDLLLIFYLSIQFLNKVLLEPCHLVLNLEPTRPKKQGIGVGGEEAKM